MRHMRIEGLTGEAFGGNGLLLMIDPFAVLILRTNQHCRRRAYGRDAIAGYRAVATQHEYVVAQYLEVIAGEVARVATFIVPVGHLPICLHRQVASETSSHPGRVTGKTAHLIFLMGQLLVISGNITPGGIVYANGLGVSRFLAVIPFARGDGVNGLLDAPPAARLNHGVLNDIADLQDNVITVLVLLLAVARH